jgi:hypothetical protein
MANPKYAIRRATNTQYYFNLHAENGEVILTSEMYNNSQARENGITAVKRVGPTAPTEDFTN